MSYSYRLFVSSTNPEVWGVLREGRSFAEASWAVLHGARPSEDEMRTATFEPGVDAALVFGPAWAVVAQFADLGFEQPDFVSHMLANTDPEVLAERGETNLRAELEEWVREMRAERTRH